MNYSHCCSQHFVSNLNSSMAQRWTKLWMWRLLRVTLCTSIRVCNPTCAAADVIDVSWGRCSSVPMKWLKMHPAFPLAPDAQKYKITLGTNMLRGVVHLSSEMCHINHIQHANDHLAEAPAEGNCCPLGTVIWVDLQPQAHLASSAALMAVLLCHPPICSPQLKINSSLHCGKVETAQQCSPRTFPNGKQPTEWKGAGIMWSYGSKLKLEVNKWLRKHTVLKQQKRTEKFYWYLLVISACSDSLYVPFTIKA